MNRRLVHGLTGALLALLAGCGGLRQERTPQAPSEQTPAPAPAQDAVRPPAAAAIALSWDDDPSRKVWSEALLAAIREHKADLERGNPDAFVAGYSTLSPDDQAKYWAELVIAMAKYESNWNPHARLKEPPPLNVTSLGLLQLSYEDAKQYELGPLDRNTHSLEDPAVNLRCGVAILAHLLARDHTVAAGRGDASRGGARYWAVLREGRKHRLAEIKSYVRHALGMA